MTRSIIAKLEPFDLEIEITFHHLFVFIEIKLSPRKQRQEMDNTPIAGARAGGAQEAHRSLMDYAQPSLSGATSCIKRPNVQSNNFELKPSFIQMIQNSV